MLYEEILNIHAPIKRTHMRNSHPPWTNPTIQCEIKLRNCLYKKYPRQCNDTWLDYKAQRNKVTKLKRESLKDYYSAARTDSDFWK